MKISVYNDINCHPELDSGAINVDLSVGKEEPSPEFLSSLQLTKKFNPLTEREGNSFSDTVFSRFTSHFSLKSAAFTLAEVLITLGIIGVVAALTLPTLTSNYRKKVVATRLKKFYSNINQAIALSETQNGAREQWALCAGNQASLSCEVWYNIYLKNYLKTLSVEHYNQQQDTLVNFPDGSAVIIARGYDFFFYPFAKDVNKEDRLTDRGTKIFAFQFYPSFLDEFHASHAGKGVEPYRAIVCENDENGNKVCPTTLSKEELLNNKTYGCNKNSKYKVYCTALIQENNWEIPSDYPFRL